MTPSPSADDPRIAALILAAGIGRRLEEAEGRQPKCLLRFAGQSLLGRQLEGLIRGGVRRVAVALGHASDLVEAEIAATAARRPDLEIATVFNPRFREGSVLSLHGLRASMGEAEVVLLMDADVLCDDRMLQRLLETRHENCFLLDRDLESGDEPVKIAIRNRRVVDFGKRIEVPFDAVGESVGFFRLSREMAEHLMAAAGRCVAGRRAEASHEEALRELLLARPERFGFEDVTGLPWIEIDFPADLTRAREAILPQLLEPVS